MTYIIYPPLCPVCKKIVDERGELCDNCSKNIFRLDEKVLLPEILSGIFIVTKYTGGTRDILRKIKFDSDLREVQTAKKILDTVADNDALKKFISQTDFATFVPLHSARFKERGFNQTELIFDDFLKKLLPIENILIRHKPTPKLFKFNRQERQEILQGAFSTVEGANVKGKKILLVDDIYTTGATVSECAKVLKDNGASKIFVLAFASNSSLENPNRFEK